MQRALNNYHSILFLRCAVKCPKSCTARSKILKLKYTLCRKMENPPVRKTRRALTLAKPAPRKNCLDNVPCMTMTEGPSNVITDASSHEKQDKENLTFKKRACRGLKLEKPAPLKSSKINNSELQAKVETAPLKQNEDVTKKKETLFKREDEVSKIVNPAEIKANMLIKEALSDLEVTQIDTTPPKSMQRQTRLLSQVSDDSGLGDMSAYSRQGSLLESLAENQDDLDWDNLENTSTFTFGQQQMTCLSTTVNQMVPFNSLTLDDIQGQDRLGNSARQRKHSHQDTRNHVKKPQFHRSYSVPSNLSISKGTECWEDDVELPKNNVVKEEIVKRNSEVDIENVDEFGSCSDLVNRDHIKREVVVKHDNWTKANHFTIKDFTVVVTKEIQHSNRNVFHKPSKQVSDEWESEIIEVEQNTNEMSERENERPVTPSNAKTCSGAGTYSAIYNDGSDLDATPKAGFALSKYKDFNLSVERFEKSGSDLAELYWERRSGSATDGDLKKETDDSTVISNNCDMSGVEVKSLPSYQNYREKTDNYLSCSSRTSTETDDVISSCHSDDGFNEQMYAWELIEDLSSKVNSLKLENGSPEEKKRVVQNGTAKVEILPDDINDIEAELEFMREDIRLLERLKSDEVRSSNSVLKSGKVSQWKNAVVQVIREPLTPYSTQTDIWRVEEGMPTGFGSALSRRKMFRYFKQSLMEEKVNDVKLIQYTAKELLEIGASDLSKRKLESWSMSEHLYPDICLKKGFNFDTLRYKEEREYVCEVHNAENIERRQSSKGNNSGLPNVRRPPPTSGVNRGGFGVPQSGIGFPQSGFGASQSGFGVPKSGHSAPQSGFGAPQGGLRAFQSVHSAPPQSGFGAPQSGFGAPKGGFDAPQSGFDAPQSGFGAPQSGFGAPKGGFDAPQSGFGSSQGCFSAPNSVFSAPKSGFGVPPTRNQSSTKDLQQQRSTTPNDDFDNVTTTNANADRHGIKPPKPNYGRSFSMVDRIDTKNDDLVLKRDLPEVCPW
ncbi:uncharacterized protein LOC132753529 [Ruditapes philippinarum]|uniref:uncharacterized protein LOC132753529 n=1 Tax=Ruditapes philippinarum TaxID=129788 RepID=UPI00295AAE42|nr:uncharacterized protein LOC132753529 [Ruditapes philippinarum]